jgi:lipopolysaccharide biosynthesis protein
VYYDDLWPEISRRLHDWDIEFRLYVTTVHDRSDGLAAAVSADWPDALVTPVPNRGRDMAPFLQQARIAIDRGADLLCKVHTKKSPHRSDGERWRRELYRQVLGDRTSVRAVLHAFAGNPDIGIVAPAGYAISSRHCWQDNADRVLELAARIGCPGIPAPFVFAAGSMFWMRSEALQPILRLGLTPDDFEEETRQLDGTLAHALERLFPIAAQVAGYRLADTRILGRTRYPLERVRRALEARAFMSGGADYRNRLRAGAAKLLAAISGRRRNASGIRGR